jgi:hypothetical protein
LSADDEQGIVAAYQDMVYDTSAPAGCTQASVLGVRPDADVVQLTGWLLAMLCLGHRTVRRREARVRHTCAPLTLSPPRPSLAP